MRDGHIHLSDREIKSLVAGMRECQRQYEANGWMPFVPESIREALRRVRYSCTECRSKIFDEFYPNKAIALLYVL